MKVDYDWLKPVYQDIAHERLRYTQQIPNLYFVSETRLNKSSAIEHTLIDANHYPKDQYDVFAEFYNRKPSHAYFYEMKNAPKYKHTTSQGTLDTFIHHAIDGTLTMLMVDNSFLQNYAKTNYHVVILSSVDDYIKNQYPKAVAPAEAMKLDTYNDSALMYQYDTIDLYTRCMLFIDQSGAYFYAIPLHSSYENNYEKDITKDRIINDHLFIQKESHFPIIEVTCDYLNQLLKSLPLRAEVIKGTNNKLFNLYYCEGYLNNWSTCLSNDSADQFTYSDFTILDIQISRPRSQFNQKMNIRLNNREIEIEAYNKSLVQEALSNHAELIIDQQGKIYYDVSDCGDFWKNYFQHIFIQDLSSAILPSYEKVSSKKDNALYKIFASDWSNMKDDEHTSVEHISLKTNQSSMEPIMAAKGLSQIFEMSKNGPKHQYYVYQDHLWQLNYYPDYKQLSVTKVSAL